MYEEPEENPLESSRDPKVRANEKANEFRMHAELAAVFEGKRKFDAAIVADLQPVAIELQRRIGKLEKSKLPDTPIIAPESASEVTSILNFPAEKQLSTSDYHIFRRPGEVILARWLQGEQVATFYDRLQKHFDAAWNNFVEEEQSTLEWRLDEKSESYLKTLGETKIDLSERYLRAFVKANSLNVLSTQTADEINIKYLCEYLFDIPIAELVGARSAPPDDPSDSDLAWFFKLFSLRGVQATEERMCFFVYLQRTDDSFGDE